MYSSSSFRSVGAQPVDRLDGRRYAQSERAPVGLPGHTIYRIPILYGQPNICKDQDGIIESAVVAGWSEALGELHERIGRRFARSEARERVKRYLVGLLLAEWSVRTAG